jgi:hypothetical protein
MTDVKVTQNLKRYAEAIMIRRAEDAARATPGPAPQGPRVHLRSVNGGNNTKCGNGGISFKPPITDDPAEATCKNCLKVQHGINRDREMRALATRSLYKAD